MVSEVPQHATDTLASLLAAELPGRVRRHVMLSEISRWRIGGPAAIYVEPRSSAEAARVMALMADRPEPLFIMGDSTNTLFDDRGFSGVIMRIGRNLSAMEIGGKSVWAQAGVWMPHFAKAVGSAGLGGIEHTIGIPGTLGGLIVMNGGSQRKGIGVNVKEALCADEHGNFFALDQTQCGFSYRTSALQRRRVVLLEATLQFQPRSRQDVRADMLSILRDRRGKFPQKLPNCGSTFLSNPAMYEHVGPPGRVIEGAGLKGLRRGGAQISKLHANFIVNTGGATSDDVLWLINHIRSEVFIRTGYAMDCEVRHLSPEGVLRAAHESALERWRSRSSGVAR
ncbi:UDP-N-acetylmuramate dehydrogenase [Luteimonas sp. BDR2-5]|uniref:UDP-N-acetylmuramate dehydrogenase n=1 Tax=Proluteimonas luteida TaxID=2878685 RepID=UPI001E47A726|nr:UDP-N-acetylmuramate dehydrogenase [Luteimonas sp. BDR2-5]MCD9029527.1 UDP-N-acetylmuramate dehydrogenase [Luteimonas sp. BDR2-5]